MKTTKNSANTPEKRSPKSLIAQVDPKLKEYIELNIFPQYSKNDWGHQIGHINYVIRRSFEFAETVSSPATANSQEPSTPEIPEPLNPNVLYTAAAYHDLGHQCRLFF